MPNKTWLSVPGNREKWNAYQKECYLKKTGGLVRNKLTDEDRVQYYRDKANNRATRAKEARRHDELTKLATAEAHDLRKRRERITGFKWHVDHIIPLLGEDVRGLHVWYNLQVVPASWNLKKGNNYAVYEKWSP